MKNRRVVVEMLRRAVKNYEESDFKNDHEERAASEVLLQTARFALINQKKSLSRRVFRGIGIMCGIIGFLMICNLALHLPELYDAEVSFSAQQTISEVIQQIVS